VVEYAIATKMPILAVCQGFQMIQMIVADLQNEEYIPTRSSVFVS
jgi:gamma-glutamyl-gamma-aminobutyrate hydrolase PuuD